MRTELPYVVVLAGGEGNRLASLTRALYGLDLPKQFAVLSGQRSLLQTTLDRAAQLTTPERISVVVTSHHEPIAREQLSPYPGVELVVQPRNLDTAAGILLPLARILARTRNERVVFLPSDHYISDPAPIAHALRSAAAHDRIALIGVAPTGPEVEYGWIECGKRLGDAFEVERFQEKPHAAAAEALWRAGGLWNTFILTGPARALWELARRHLARHTEMLERYANDDTTLEAAYDAMSPASFSRDVLAHASDLVVFPVVGSGWSDWGSPHRVFASLAGTPCHDRLVERIRGDFAMAV